MRDVEGRTSTKPETRNQKRETRSPKPGTTRDGPVGRGCVPHGPMGSGPTGISSHRWWLFGLRVSGPEFLTQVFAVTDAEFGVYGGTSTPPCISSRPALRTLVRPKLASGFPISGWVFGSESRFTNVGFGEQRETERKERTREKRKGERVKREGEREERGRERRERQSEKRE